MPWELGAGAAADFALLRATDEAEARGDARGALELIEQDLARREDEHFWRPERLQRLLQLSALAPVLPRWTTSRWILAQAAQWLDTSNRDRMHRALQVALDLGGASHAAGGDVFEQNVKIVDHDWVFRQAFLYELGGLQHFLDRVASADLVAGADRIRDWARRPMGGFRFLRETPRVLTWRDLGNGEVIETVNIGSATLLEPRDCAIGRLVPVEGGSMFETVPLLVSEPVARAVSAEPHGWLATLSIAGRDAESGELEIRTSGHDFSLLTDVPGVIRRLVALQVAEQTNRAPAVIAGPGYLRSLELGLVRAALDGKLPERAFDISPWPTVAATLLNPGLLASLDDRLGTEDGPALRRLSELLPSPAAEMCRAFADDTEAAA